MKQLFRSLSTVAGAIAILAGSAPAVAAIVDVWGYSTNASFISATYETGGSGTTVTDSYELSWGYETGDFQNPVDNFRLNRSALTIGKGSAGNNRIGGGPVTGSINTRIGGGLPDISLGEVGMGITFSHWNNPISSAFNTLTGGTVRDTLTLTPTSPSPPYDGSVSIPAPTIDFSFKFSETPNNPGAGGCAGGTDEPCADLYGIIGFLNFNQTFTFDGQDYFASIFVLGPGGGASPVGTLLDEECAVLGLDNGCVGFRTAESAVTTAQFAFSITTDRFPIPEPGSLALVGLALAGLGMASRRRSFKG